MMKLSSASSLAVVSVWIIAAFLFLGSNYNSPLLLAVDAFSSIAAPPPTIVPRLPARRRALMTLCLSKNTDPTTNSPNEPEPVLSRQEALQQMLQRDGVVDDNQKNERRNLAINVAVGGLLAVSAVATFQLFQTNVYTPTGFTRLYPTQFIAALGDPKASSGQIKEPWGLWRLDPGPRGVWLWDYDKQFRSSPVAPAGWTMDDNDFWVEEHGLIMEAPDFPLAPGRYLVTGGRSVTTGLNIDEKGNWKLDEGTLYDVTHLPCRSARYQQGTPQNANYRNFPVSPGAEMPSIDGCTKQDYAVLFLVGRAMA